MASPAFAKIAVRAARLVGGPSVLGIARNAFPRRPCENVAVDAKI